MSDLGDEILQGLKEALAYKKGELIQDDGIKKYSALKVPNSVDVRAIRAKLGLTQEEFSKFGFSVRSIQNWERGIRKPESAARTLLKVISQHPTIVLDTLRK